MKRQYLLSLLVLVAFIKAEFTTAPAYEGWDSSQVTYDASRGVYVDSYKIPMDNIFLLVRHDDPELYQRILEQNNGPHDIPAKRKLTFKLRKDLFRDEKNFV